MATDDGSSAVLVESVVILEIGSDSSGGCSAKSPSPLRRRNSAMFYSGLPVWDYDALNNMRLTILLNSTSSVFIRNDCPIISTIQQCGQLSRDDNLCARIICLCVCVCVFRRTKSVWSSSHMRTSWTSLNAIICCYVRVCVRCVSVCVGEFSTTTLIQHNATDKVFFVMDSSDFEKPAKIAVRWENANWLFTCNSSVAEWKISNFLQSVINLYYSVLFIKWGVSWGKWGESWVECGVYLDEWVVPWVELRFVDSFNKDGVTFYVIRI